MTRQLLSPLGVVCTLVVFAMTSAAPAALTLRIVNNRDGTFGVGSTTPYSGSGDSKLFVAVTASAPYPTGGVIQPGAPSATEVYDDAVSLGVLLPAGENGILGLFTGLMGVPAGTYIDGIQARLGDTIKLYEVKPDFSLGPLLDTKTLSSGLNLSMEDAFVQQPPLGDVAEGWTGWSAGACLQGFASGSEAHEGSKSQQISWHAEGGNGFGPDGIYQQIEPLQPGRTYRASAWFKSSFAPEGWMSNSFQCTYSVGTDPNGGTNPDVVTNWISISEYSYDAPWMNVFMFFSPNSTSATVFIKVDGYGESWNEDWPGMTWPAPWTAYCYMDDVALELLQIGEGSSVEAISPVPANGANCSQVTITILNASGNPIVGIPASAIDVNCTGSGNVISGPDNSTDQSGQTTARIASTVAEVKTVSVTVFGTPLSNTATVEFGQPYFGPHWFVDASNNGYANGSAEYPFRKIMDAITPAQNGDTINVRAGIYQENVDNSGKALTIRSKNPRDWSVVEATVIDANNKGSAVVFTNPNPEVMASCAILGFTVTRGSAGDGGGICCTGFLTIENNIITNNVASSRGGGICCSGYPIINNNIISLNKANYGGAIGSHGGFPIVRNSVLLHNSANYYGGGEYGHIGLLENCLIAYNSTGVSWGNGGGIYDIDGTIINCTIAYNNTNNDGGGLYLCDGTIKNCIIWQNSAGRNGDQFDSCSEPTYSCIQDWAGGGLGNINGNPLFVDPDSNDYHLRSTAGRWDPQSSTWITDAATSPCIDAGDILTPIGVEPNPNGARINMGAYGGTREASKSPSGIVKTVCIEYPPMDLNKDCKVDFMDFAIFSQSWLECNLDPPELCW